MNQWNRTAKFFHWMVALLFVVAAVVGTMAESQAMSPAKLQLFVTHKSIGITVLGLMLLRLLWRLRSAAPASLDGLSVNSQRYAALGHAGLYALLIALPLSGWLLTSAANFPFRWFGWIKMPMLWPADEAMQDLAGLAHWSLFIAAVVLVVGHAGMALWHTRMGLPVLPRMFPVRPAPAWFLLMLLLSAAVVAAVARVQSIQAPDVAAGQVGLPGPDSRSVRQTEVDQENTSASQNENENESHDQSAASAPVESKSAPVIVAANAAITKPSMVAKPGVAAIPQAPAPPPSWVMLPANSSLGFIGSYTGEEFRGHFARFEPTIIFDPNNLNSARIEVVVDVTSATLGSADMDAMLPEPEWFNFKLYPKALFKASQFSKQAGGFVARGELLLKGRSQPVTLKLEWRAQSANRARLRVDATLNRVAFGIGSGEWAQDPSIGFEVRVHADLALQIDQAL